MRMVALMIVGAGLVCVAAPRGLQPFSRPRVASALPAIRLTWRSAQPFARPRVASEPRAAARLTLPGRPTWQTAVDGLAGALFATDGQVFWLDLGDASQPRIGPVVRTRSGSRWAGEADELGYVFDRHGLHALRLAPGEPVHPAWGASDAPDPAVERGDPEFITRILDVAPTPRGPLVVRSDGVLGLIGREGRLAWQSEIEPLRAATLLAAGSGADGSQADGSRADGSRAAGSRAGVSRAALITRHGDATRVRQFAIEAAAPQSDAVELADVHALRESLGAAGLTLVGSSAVVRIDRAGGETRQTLPSGGLMTLAATVIIEGPAGAEVWTIDEGRLVRLPPDGGVTSTPLPDGATWRALRADGDALFALADDRFAWLSAADPAEPRAVITFEPGLRVWDVRLVAGDLYVLLRDASDAAHAALKTFAGPSDRSPRELPLSGAGALVGHVWTDRFFVALFERDAVVVELF